MRCCLQLRSSYEHWPELVTPLILCYAIVMVDQRDECLEDGICRLGAHCRLCEWRLSARRRTNAHTASGRVAHLCLPPRQRRCSYHALFFVLLPCSARSIDDHEGSGLDGKGRERARKFRDSSDGLKLDLREPQETSPALGRAGCGDVFVTPSALPILCTRALRNVNAWSFPPCGLATVLLRRDALGKVQGDE